MKLKLIADDNIPAVRQYLGSLFDITLVNGRALSRDQLLEADALLVRSVTRVDENLLAETGVSFVGSATSGTDHMDQTWLAQTGITFCHAPGSNANSVVEYVLAAVAATGQVLERLLVAGRVGIVGYGRVGAALAARLEALGINWCAYDPLLAKDEIARPASLEQVLDCELICLHPELTCEGPWPSYHLIGAAELARLGDHQLLINASRGAVIDNKALLHCLGEPLPPAVVLDVWEQEPWIEPELLRQVSIGTAHIAGYSLDGKVLATRMLARQLLAHFGMETQPGAGPLSDIAPVVLAGAGSPAEAMRQLIEQRYPIARDDQLLRQAVFGSDDNERAAQFDVLRKQYAERRELVGSKVVVASSDVQYLDIVRALGAEPVLQKD